MLTRAALLVVVLTVVGGCSYHEPYRDPCDQDADSTCCPPGSHRASDFFGPGNIICARDEAPDTDAGADGGACDDAGSDAY